ncbi:MAG: TIR domain-containing protein [Gemmatimonadales bacterium]
MDDHAAFVSYSSRDQEIADSIVTALEHKEIRCWIASRDVQAGESWAAAIIKALEAAQVLILLYSADANISPQVLREVERAVAKGVVIVVFRLDHSQMAPDMEYFVSLCQWLEADPDTLDDSLARLARIVRQWLPDAQSKSEHAMQVRATALYADFAGYTPMAESEEWELLVRWLDDYIRSFGACIERHGGTVGHCMGDGIMAYFGVAPTSDDPRKVQGDARNAVRCALAMCQELEDLKARWADQGLSDRVVMRVGLSHGWMTVSHHEIAGEYRANYFGAPVDLAMRFNRFANMLDRTGSLTIAIDDRTRALLDQTFQISGPETVQAIGRKDPLQVWSVTG